VKFVSWFSENAFINENVNNDGSDGKCGQGTDQF
jgi:hypothetical protein